MKGDSNCTLCKLHKDADRVCVLGVGPKKSKAMVVAESPGNNGRAEKLLNELLRAEELDPEEMFFATAVSCDTQRTPTKTEIKSCKHWLEMQIDLVQPKVVLLLGNSPLLSITGSPGIKKARGRPFEKDGIIYVPTYHPSIIFHDDRNRVLIEQDIRLFRAIIEKGSIPREDALNLKIVRNRKQFVELLNALRGCVSFDIETTGLYPWAEDAKVVSIGFGTKEGEFHIPFHHPESPWSADALEDMVEELTEELEHCQVVTHNGKFDYLWMKVHYKVDWYEFASFDTMLAHYLLDENSAHGLKFLAQAFCGAPNWDVDAATKKGVAPLAVHCLYAAHDVHYTRKLRYVLGKMMLKDPKVKRVFDYIMMPCMRMFVEIENDGVHLDLSKFADAEIYLRTQYDQALSELKGFGDINWGSPQQVAKLLFEDFGLPIVEKTAAGKPSTSESVIKRIDHPCTAAMLRFRAAKQQLSFFIDGWKPFLDGSLLHPSFKLHGTVTGRLSCENPNLQQVPRDPRIRTLISAPDGWTLVECDLSQIELRIAAEIANERKMIWAFNNGVDTHWLTAMKEIERSGALKDLVIATAETATQRKGIRYAEAIEILLKVGPNVAADINPEWKEYRKKAKAINFGYLYGMWWKKFKDYARDNYGVIVTDKEAEESRNSFFDNYPDYPNWHKRQRRFANENGYVQSLSGRKRRLPEAMSSRDTPERREAERQAINSPVQSFANDINLMSALQMRQEFGRDAVRMCGTVHDAILLRVKNEYVEHVTTRLLEIMQRPQLFDVFEISLSVPVEGEAKVGPWAAGKDLSKWLAANQHIKQKRYQRKLSAS